MISLGRSPKMLARLNSAQVAESAPALLSMALDDRTNTLGIGMNAVADNHTHPRIT
jgi:hypothetical protein